MGAITILPSQQLNWLNSINTVMARRGFSIQQSFELGSYRIILHRKLLGRDSVNVSLGQNRLMICGTLIYRGLGLIQSAKGLLDDLSHNRVDMDQVFGQYVGLAILGNQIQILTDKYAILPLYYRTDHPVLSTSFLALSSFCQDSLSINKQAVFEILFGQGVVPPETQLAGINRYVPIDKPLIPSIMFTTFSPSMESETPAISLEKAIEEQVARLDNYMSQVKASLIEEGSIIGLSGGFDSRMMYALMKRHGIAPQVYTHWQNGASDDFRISNLIAKSENLKLDIIKKHAISAADSDDPYQQAYLFTDGQCRIQYYWSEYYYTLGYQKELNPQSLISINGVGGEQYRNSEGVHLWCNNWPDWLYKYIFTRAKWMLPRKLVNSFLEKHIQKVNNIMAIQAIPDITSKKKYYNRIYGYTCRYYRAGFECQATNHLSPYCDAYLAEYAYRSIPFIGKLYRFQKGMLDAIDHKLASLPSSHGFAFSERTPYYYAISQYVFQKIPYLRYAKECYKNRKVGWDLTEKEQDKIQSLLGHDSIRFPKISASMKENNLIKQLLYFVSKSGVGE